MPGFNRNDFLLDLLSLQQDGSQAISAPSNWVDEPILEVETEVDSIIDELEKTILVGGSDNRVARWHFFIGSPGNGKSAAMGKLCRRLSAGSACRVQDENGTLLEELAPTEVPYAMNVFEAENKFMSVQIIQDASVVRNPFRKNVDPASELLETLRTAWEKGISLIVCTNRGVLEKAHRDNHIDQSVNSKPWFKVLSGIVSAEATAYKLLDGTRTFDGRKSVFEQLHVSCCHLDNRSLLLELETFEDLLAKATASDKWSDCESCAAKGMCPFSANRDWLTDDDARSNVLKLLRRAEVLSGQIIVFREALAIISLLLAGCPKDYEQLHPCEWVQAAINSGDIFSLAARRVYMSLFASFAPHGLESSSSLRARQVAALKTAANFLEGAEDKTRRALDNVVGGQSPSIDVGVTRILGSGGVLAMLDPCLEALPDEFYQKWDADFRAAIDAGSHLLTDLEGACIAAWAEIEDCLESASDHSVTEAHWALQRWASNFLLHFGSLFEGRSAWGMELDEFANLLSLVGIPAENRSVKQKRKIRQLDGHLEGLLSTVSGDGVTDTVRLSDVVTLSGPWVRENLKPHTVANIDSGSVSLSVEFDGGEKAVFGATMYLWLTRRAQGKLDSRCFPQRLMSGASDARVRAASKGQYAFQDDGVTLSVDAGKHGVFELARFDGEVDITNE